MTPYTEKALETLSNVAESGRPAPMSNAEWVQALRGGDALVQAAAWARVGRLARRVVGRFFGPGLDPGDLVQDVLLRLAVRLHELRDPDSLAAFVAGVALGVARNQARRARLRRMVGLTPTGESPEVAIAESDMEARDGIRRFYAILDQASAEDRSLFVARFLEKMELAEIAAAHGLSFGTAKRRMARAIDRIGRRISRDPGLAEYLERAGGLT